MENSFCRHCNRTLPISELHVETRALTWDGRPREYFSCRACTSERARKYRSTPSGADSTSRSTKKFREKNRVKARAWVLAQKISVLPCSVCGSKDNVQKHHEDYTRPLDVIFFCAKHHKRHHMQSVV
jgi:hypothetical protein